jgi:hypothetical protein
MRDLERILPELGAAARLVPFELIVSSNSRAAYEKLTPQPGLVMRYVPWRRGSFPFLAASVDVAVLPVEVNEVTRSKTSNRIATALGYGLAVVTDPLPSYLAYSGALRFSDYATSVPDYLRDPASRHRDVARGRTVTQSLYAPAVVTAQWRQVIEVAASRRAQTT